MFLPRVEILEVASGSASHNAGLRSGDQILKINDEEVFYVSDYLSYVNEYNRLSYTVLRGEYA